MSRTKKYRSNLWECPKAINAYCEEISDMLLKYLDDIFEDLMGTIDREVVKPEWQFC